MSIERLARPLLNQNSNSGRDVPENLPESLLSLEGEDLEPSTLDITDDGAMGQSEEEGIFILDEEEDTTLLDDDFAREADPTADAEEGVIIGEVGEDGIHSPRFSPRRLSDDEPTSPVRPNGPRRTYTAEAPRVTNGMPPRPKRETTNSASSRPSNPASQAREVSNKPEPSATKPRTIRSISPVVIEEGSRLHQLARYSNNGISRENHERLIRIHNALVERAETSGMGLALQLKNLSDTGMTASDLYSSDPTGRAILWLRKQRQNLTFFLLASQEQKRERQLVVAIDRVAKLIDLGLGESYFMWAKAAALNPDEVTSVNLFTETVLPKIHKARRDIAKNSALVLALAATAYSDVELATIQEQISDSQVAALATISKAQQQLDEKKLEAKREKIISIGQGAGGVGGGVAKAAIEGTSEFIGDALAAIPASAGIIVGKVVKGVEEMFEQYRRARYDEGEAPMVTVRPGRASSTNREGFLRRIINRIRGDNGGRQRTTQTPPRSRPPVEEAETGQFYEPGAGFAPPPQPRYSGSPGGTSRYGVNEDTRSRVRVRPPINNTGEQNHQSDESPTISY